MDIKLSFLIMIPGDILRKLDSILYYNATFLKNSLEMNKYCKLSNNQENA